MNIFLLDKHPVLAAQYHCDRHVLKMLVEYAQILSTVNWLYGEKATYKPTHKHHPSVKWAWQNSMNYTWLYLCWEALNNEYKIRYPKAINHGSFDKCRDDFKVPPAGMLQVIMPEGLKFSYLITHVNMEKEFQAMPPAYKDDDPVKAYRDYYMGEKRFTKSGSPMAVWTNRNTPYWYGP